jgi:hypothetical protein
MDNVSIVPGDCEKLFNLALAAPKTKFILRISATVAILAD